LVLEIIGALIQPLIHQKSDVFCPSLASAMIERSRTCKESLQVAAVERGGETAGLDDNPRWKG
jgi:hypothetical protein